MRVEKIGKEQILQTNERNGYFSYFAWPSVARLQDGRIAVVSSGFRNDHTCPFGKSVISYSDDDGRTFSPPAPVIDTPLDDRDSGIVAWGRDRVIVTSFNRTVENMRKRSGNNLFWNAYIDSCIPEDAEEKYFGSTYRISTDCGKTFGPLERAPVSSPHGPVPLGDGSLLWTGNHHGRKADPEDKLIHVYRMTPDGTFTKLSSIGPILDENGILLEIYEPHTVLLPSGVLLCHIRCERGNEMEVFTTYQTESRDGGITWTAPHRILPVLGGATAFLSVHSSGTVLSCCQRREPPFQIRVLFSEDEGRTWNTENFIFSRELYENYSYVPNSSYPGNDLGYPSTVELRDGSLFTVFYCRYPGLYDKAAILGQRWRLAED